MVHTNKLVHGEGVVGVLGLVLDVDQQLQEVRSHDVIVFAIFDRLLYHVVEKLGRLLVGALQTWGKEREMFQGNGNEIN